ncbi:MAG: ribosome maturation factor RimP [Microthrixaceae bacterium]
MSNSLDRITDLLDPIAEELGLSVYDLENSGGTIRILLDREGGIDMGAITTATRKISSALDEADFISSAYTLEVSSPGIERTLRTEDHFRGAIGERVKIKARRNVDLERRIEGRLEAFDDGTISVLADDGTVTQMRISDIERARTQFVDTAAPKPGKAPRSAKGPKAAEPENSSNDQE